MKWASASCPVHGDQPDPLPLVRRSLLADSPAPMPWWKAAARPECDRCGEPVPVDRGGSKWCSEVCAALAYETAQEAKRKPAPAAPPKPPATPRAKRSRVKRPRPSRAKPPRLCEVCGQPLGRATRRDFTVHKRCPRPPLDPAARQERDEQIAVLAGSGSLSTRAIAAQVGVSQTAVVAALKRSPGGRQ